MQKESKAFHKGAEWEDLGSHPRMTGKTNVRFLLPDYLLNNNVETGALVVGLPASLLF